jgi:exocyst complex component 1
VDALKKRVDKHFGEGDETGLARNLVLKVQRECEARYEDVAARTREIAKAVYGDEGGGWVELMGGWWGKDDVVSAFRK